MLDEIDLPTVGRRGCAEGTDEAPSRPAARAGRARGDFARGAGRRILSRDRAADGTRPVDRRAGNRGPWRPRALPRVARGCPGSARRAASESAQARALRTAAARGRTGPGAAVVAPTDRRAARDRLSGRCHDAGVARDHLPIAVRASAGGVTARLGQVFAHRPGAPPPSTPGRLAPGAHPRDGVDQ